jgi:hypothetical protein
MIAIAETTALRNRQLLAVDCPPWKQSWKHRAGISVRIVHSGQPA